MKQTKVSFGTSGHRGIMGDSFTLSHTHAIAQAIAQFAKSKNPSPKIIIGYDTRTGNSTDRSPGSYTESVCQSLIMQGVDVLFCDAPTPTPVISWAITHYKLDGGIILTASHNPPNYNGIKFNPSNGAPAPKEITEWLEKEANNYLNQPLPSQAHTGSITPISPIKEFAQDLRTKLSALFPINSDLLSSNKLIIDAKHGAVSPTWHNCLSEFGIPYTLINEAPLPNFGECNPNPCNIEGLSQLKTTLLNEHASMGISNDPDGDRHIILDENGTPLSPEEITVIICDYCSSINLPIQGIASTLASSNIIKETCRALNLSHFETKVGFKYFAPHLSHNTDTLTFGVESSGGFSASFHTLEKCGFLPGIIMSIIAANTNKTISQLKNESLDKYGRFIFKETQISYDSSGQDRILNKLQSFSQTEEHHFTHPIQSVSLEDGLKITFTNNDWVLARPSGTEPVIRVYQESKDKNADYTTALKTLLLN